MTSQIPQVKAWRRRLLLVRKPLERNRGLYLTAEKHDHLMQALEKTLDCPMISHNNSATHNAPAF
jgi:hypothetical protein